MARVLIVGDDLTGVNGTGARFARAGMSVATVDAGRADEIADQYDVVVVNTDSRHLGSAAAAARVAEAVRAVGPVELVVKRTDSTLRGNVGAEVEAALGEVRASTEPGRPVRGLVVPAFVEAGRVTVDGVQLLHGVPLERTELATDPMNPMRTSAVSEIFARQTDLDMRHVPLREVTGSADGLVSILREGQEPLVLCDAFADDHVTAIADAAAEVSRRDGTVWVSVDPGPAAASLAWSLSIRARSQGAAPVLAVVGSATELTRRQLDVVQRDEQVHLLEVDIEGLARGETADLESRLIGELRTRRYPDVVVVHTALAAPVDLDAHERQRLPRLLAELVARAVLETPVSGLYTTGGDVTAAVLAAGGSQAFEVSDEVVPLAVLGTIVGGLLDGLPMVTKGGLVGEETAAKQCLSHLSTRVEGRLRRVRSEIGKVGARGDTTEQDRHCQEGRTS